MAFAPRNKQNAIAEVAFVITLAATPEEHKIKAFLDTHEADWSDDLPIKEELRGQKFQFGPNLADGPKFIAGSLSGARFRTLQRDGSLDWQVAIEDQLLKVNCGSYTRWANVWPTAKDYLQRLVQSFVSETTSITSLGLEYIDEFVWTGDLSEYDVSSVFDPKSEYFLSRMCNAGYLWHLHQGWFTQDGLPKGDRRLERIHIDALEEGPNIRYPTRIASTLRHDLGQVVDDPDYLFTSTEGKGFVDSSFVSMHERNKQILKSLLTEEMAARIGL